MHWMIDGNQTLNQRFQGLHSICGIFLTALVCIWSESKNTFNITMSGSGDLLTNRVSRQTVSVGARMWVYFMFMWVAAISLTKGALIDTFGTLAGRAELGAASRHQTSLCLTTGYTTQRPLPSQNTAKYHNQTFNCYKGSVTLRSIAKLSHSPVRAEPVFAGIRTVLHCAKHRAGRASSPGVGCAKSAPVFR